MSGSVVINPVTNKVTVTQQENKVVISPLGAQGPTGATGPQGPSGSAGETGPQGPTGSAATISVGSTTTASAGSSASVTNVGSSSAAILNFIIPQGLTGPAGATGDSSTHYHYNARTNTTSGDPTINQLGWSSSTQISSSALRVNHLDADNQDNTIFLNLIKQEDVLIIQDKNDAVNYQKWKVSGSPTYNTTWDLFPVTLISSSGLGTTNFSNNHALLFIIFSAGTAGSSGVISVNYPITNIGTSSSAILGLSSSYVPASATYASSANNSTTTSQTNFSALTLSGSNVATQAYVLANIPTVSSSSLYAASAGYLSASGLSASTITIGTTTVGLGGSATSLLFASAGFNASGQIYTGSVAPLTNLAGTTQAQLSAVSSASNTIPLIVRRNAAGTANTFELQTSGGQPYIYVDQNMVLYSGAAFNAQPSTIDGTPINAYPTSANHRGDLLKITNNSQTITRAAFNAIGQMYTGATQPILTTVSTISSINASAFGASVTTTASSNNLSVGQIVYITGASPSEYNGNFYVNTIISSSSFLISKSTAFATSSAVTPGTVSLPPQLSVTTSGSTTSGIIVRGSASQSVDLQQWQDSASTVKAYVNNVGVISAAGFTTGGTSVFNYTTTFQNATVIPLIAKNLGGIADIQQWQNSSASILAGVTASGFIYTGSAGPLLASTGTGGSAAHLSIATASSNPAIVIRPSGTFDSGTNSIEIFNSSAATTPSLSINKSGQITLQGISSNGGLGSNTTNNLAAFRSLLSTASTAAFLGRAVAGHTADMLQIQASTGSSLLSVTSTGRLVINIPNGTQFSTASSMLDLQTSSSITPGIIVKSSASQTADLQQWQNSTGSVLASINASGQFTGYSSSAGTLYGLNSGSGILKYTSSSTWQLDTNYKQLYVSSSSPTAPEIGTIWINPSASYVISAIDGGSA